MLLSVNLQWLIPCFGLMQASAGFSALFSSLGTNITANNNPLEVASTIADVFGPTNDTTPPKGILYRVPGTHTVLDVIVKPNEPILSEDLAQTIHRTIEDVHNFISANNASDEPLSWFDDPFVSDERWKGCYIGVRSKRRNREPGQNPHFTIGILADVLLGLWNMLFVGGRYSEATVGIFDDTWAFVGLAMIVNDRAELEPGGIAKNLEGWNYTGVS